MAKKRDSLLGVKICNWQDVYEHNILRKQIVAYILSDFLYPWPNNNRSFICPGELRGVEQKSEEKQSHASSDIEENSTGYKCVSRIKQPRFI